MCFLSLPVAILPRNEHRRVNSFARIRLVAQSCDPLPHREFASHFRFARKPIYVYRLLGHARYGFFHPVLEWIALEFVISIDYSSFSFIYFFILFIFYLFFYVTLSYSYFCKSINYYFHGKCKRHSYFDWLELIHE